jgi:alpha-ribazole phosphatase
MKHSTPARYRGRKDDEMPRTRLYLCRHGEVVGDGRPRYNGHSDVDITDNGVIQMERLRDMLSEAPLSSIYSSDMIRTRKGAVIIGERHGIEHIEHEHFRERHVGRWELMPFEDIRKEYPDEWAAWLGDIVNYRPPEGESLSQVAARVMPALQETLEAHRGGDIVLIAHGGVNRVILSDAMSLDLRHVFRIEQSYGALNIIDYYDDGMSVVKLLNG